MHNMVNRKFSLKVYTEDILYLAVWASKIGSDLIGLLHLIPRCVWIKTMSSWRATCCVGWSGTCMECDAGGGVPGLIGKGYRYKSNRAQSWVAKFYLCFIFVTFCTVMKYCDQCNLYMKEFIWAYSTRGRVNNSEGDLAASSCNKNTCNHKQEAERAT